MSTNPSQGLTEEVTETQEPVEEQTWENNDSSNTEVPETTENSQTVQDKSNEKPKEKYVSKREKLQDYKDSYEKALKQVEWIRSISDKREAEYKKRDAEIAPLLELYKKAEAERKAAELTKLSTENPAEYQKRLIEEAKTQMLQQFGPLQQQQQEQMSQQEAVSNVNYMKQSYGEEVYKVAEPVMSQILDATVKEKGPEVGRILAQNPDALMEMAVGRMYVQQYRNLQASNQQGQKNQARAVQFAKGTAKPNAPAQRNVSTDNMSDADLKKAAYAEIVKRFKQ